LEYRSTSILNISAVPLARAGRRDMTVLGAGPDNWTAATWTQVMIDSVVRQALTATHR